MVAAAALHQIPPVEPPAVLDEPVSPACRQVLRQLSPSMKLPWKQHGGKRIESGRRCWPSTPASSSQLPQLPCRHRHRAAPQGQLQAMEATQATQGAVIVMERYPLHHRCSHLAAATALAVVHGQPKLQ